MKVSRSLALLLSLLTFATFAQADPVTLDFQFQVLDPSPSPTAPPAPDSPSFTYLDGQPFAVTFAAINCPPTVSTPGEGGYGCFVGINDTNSTITSLDLMFDNTLPPANDPGDSYFYLNSQTPDCQTTSSSRALPPAFGSASCNIIDNNTIYDLQYSGGVGIAPGDSLILVETGVDPSAFGTGVGTITVAPTPEPGSILLLSTGALCLGVVAVRRRASLLCAAPSRS